MLTLIYPHLIYGNIVWANDCQSRLDKVLKIQKKVLRIITLSPYTASSKLLFQNLKILNIHEINNMQIILFMFNCKSNKLPDHYSELFVMNNKVHKYDTRQRNNIPRKTCCPHLIKELLKWPHGVCKAIHGYKVPRGIAELLHERSTNYNLRGQHILPFSRQPVVFKQESDVNNTCLPEQSSMPTPPPEQPIPLPLILSNTDFPRSH